MIMLRALFSLTFEIVRKGHTSGKSFSLSDGSSPPNVTKKSITKTKIYVIFCGIIPIELRRTTSYFVFIPREHIKLGGLSLPRCSMFLMFCRHS